jgi:hypothetical protein
MADEDTSREPHPGSAEAVGRYGERTAGGAASFRCAAYGEVAAVVKPLQAGAEADMGLPLGRQRQRADVVIIDYWLGSTCWMAVNAERWARIEAVLSAERPDSAALHAIDSELAPFCAASAGPAIAVTAGAAPSSLTAPSTTTPTANARPGTAR